MTANDDSRRAAQAVATGEWLRIAVMGFVLAIVVFVVFFYRPSVSTVGQTSAVEQVWDATPVPELDPALVAEIGDDSRARRLQLEDAPLEHLLSKALEVTPSVARKLGMPEHAVPIAELRASPGQYRAQYLWYKGELEYLSNAKPHPKRGFQRYDGRLRLANDERVLFSVATLPQPEPVVGDWVRMEGFFMKLRDTHLPVELDRAPVLVGPELYRAYADWDAVEALDVEVLARVDDDLEHGFDVSRRLDESQDEPLWHLASYAIHRAGERSSEWWQRIAPFNTKDQFDAIRSGEVPAGTPMRILGTFIQARVQPAEVNPLGIESWTEAWVQIRDLGGKTVPVWLPRRLDASWRRNHSAVVHGYFFKRYSYEALSGDVRWTPLFVAADLERFELRGDALSNPITKSFAALVGAVVLIFFFMARRDRQQRALHEAELAGRRRKRRERAVGAAAVR